MAKSLANIERQIADLQRQADAIRQSEVSGVVDRIKVAIAHYQLTPQQLFGSRSKGAVSAESMRRGAPVKFGDGKGNTWSGRGPRPAWLRDALAGGAQLESFQAVGGDMNSSFDASKKATRTGTKRAPSAVLYGDGSGKTWTGRGPRPGWVKAHLEAGKELADLLQK